MKLTPYSKLLVMGKEAIDAALAPIRARGARKQAELELCRIEERIASMEQRITEACSKTPINFDAVIDAFDELDLASRRQSQFEKIIEELFPEKV